MKQYTVHILENAATEYERIFVENLLDNIITEHCQKFDLQFFKYFYIVDKMTYNSDARISLNDNMILLSRRLLDVLIKQSKYYDKNGPIDFTCVINDSDCVSTFLTLKNSVYHELCHMDNATYLKDLYDIGYHEKDDVKRNVAHYWVEYITHKVNYDFKELEITKQFCFEFRDIDWNLTTRLGYNNFLYNIPYFIYRCEKCYPLEFISMFGPFKTKGAEIIVNDTYSLTKKIFKQYPFNSYTQLYELEELFKKYVPV